MQNPYALLPPSIRHDERCRMFADVCQRLDELPLGNELIYKLDTTIPDSLPYLAEQFFMQGAEGWDFCLTEAEKRNIIRQAIQLKRLKGTIAGYRAIARIADAKIPFYTAPPAIPYLSAKLTEQERSRFLVRYPKMQTYRYRTQGKKLGAMLWKCIPKNNSGYKTTYPAPSIKQYLVSSDASEPFQERAFIRYPDGSETPLITYERIVELEDGSITTHVAARIPGIAYGLFLGRKTINHKFAGRFTGKQFLVLHDLAFRSFIVNFTEPYQYRQDEFKRTVQPSWSAIDVTYQEVKEHGHRQGMFLDVIYPTQSIYPVTPILPLAPLIQLESDYGRIVQSSTGLTARLSIAPQIGSGAQISIGEFSTIALILSLAKATSTVLLDSSSIELADVGNADIGYVIDTATGLTPILDPKNGIGEFYAAASLTALTPSLSVRTNSIEWLATVFRSGGATTVLNPTIGVGFYTAAALLSGVTPILAPMIGNGKYLLISVRSGTTPTLNPAVEIGAIGAAISKTGITPSLNPKIINATWIANAIKEGVTPSLNVFNGVGVFSAQATRSGNTPTLNPLTDVGIWYALFSASGATPALNLSMDTGTAQSAPRMNFNIEYNSQYLGAI